MDGKAVFYRMWYKVKGVEFLMNNDYNQDHADSVEQPKVRREISRRQFLNYTLGGTGAFMISLPLIPMLRFTVDPLLQDKQSVEFVRVAESDKITSEPQSFRFKVHQVDGWYESEPEMEAWISRDANGKVFALSPICKHLGCLVNWNTQANFPNQYFCPCHEARYTKEGKNLVVAPEPLDQYEVKEEGGWVYVGRIKPNEIA